MARRGTKQYQAIVRDKFSDSDVVLYYTPPTTKDRLEFQNNFIKRKGDTVEVELIDEQVELGLRLVTGFRKGDFERLVDGEWITFSSDKDDPDYFEGWRDWIRDFAADLIEPFVIHVFNRQTTVVSSAKESISEK